MMKAKINSLALCYVALFFFGCSHMLFSQSFTEDLSMSSSQKNKSLFLKNQEETNYKTKNGDNQVAIVQVGSFNDAIIERNANSLSKTEVVQNGSNNFIFSYKDAKSINQQIVQDGNRNVILDFGKNKNTDVNQQFLQKGSNLNIISTGLNSISKDMTIHQIGNARTISIISL